MTARGSDGTSPVVLGPPTDPAITSTLEIHPNPDGVRCVIVGAEGDEHEAPGQVEPWRTAIVAALGALGRSNTRFVWQALIGTTP
jgi:hypothetical protein